MLKVEVLYFDIHHRLQVLQGGSSEAPTKPKGRPRKDSMYADSPGSSLSHAAEHSDSDAELSDI